MSALAPTASVFPDALTLPSPPLASTLRTETSPPLADAPVSNPAFTFPPVSFTVAPVAVSPFPSMLTFVFPCTCIPVADVVPISLSIPLALALAVSPCTSAAAPLILTLPVLDSRAFASLLVTTFLSDADDALMLTSHFLFFFVAVSWLGSSALSLSSSSDDIISLSLTISYSSKRSSMGVLALALLAASSSSSCFF